MEDKIQQEKRRKIIEFIQKNPHTTYKEIRKHLGFHIENLFESGLSEAFTEAGIKHPRAFERKTRKENQEIVINYIQAHSHAGKHEIQKSTKINISGLFEGIRDAYKKSGVEYPREANYNKTPEEKQKEMINIIRNNPQVTSTELIKRVHCNFYKNFKNFKSLYELAGVKMSINSKRKIKKKQEVINFIKNNRRATQREINQTCNTHVQEIFDGGIFEAYKLAEVKFPFERIKLHGTALKDIKIRAKNFEERVAVKLSGFGNVNRLVRTKRGIADIIFERKENKAIIEVKDYQLKDISISQINQLNKYMEDCNCKFGFLICHRKPKRDNFLIGRNKITILEESEIRNISDILDGNIV